MKNHKKFNNFYLTGKTALITGAGGLLGAQHALALLESGATVILSDLDERTCVDFKKIYSSNFKKDQIKSIKLDVTSPDNISQVYEKLLNDDISVDILINNAAIDPKVSGDQGIIETSRLENFSLEQWNNQLSVGLTGAFLCSKVFGVAMAKKGKGVILNIASDLSVIAPDQRLYKKKDVPDNLQAVKPVTYSVIKTGLIGLTRYLATYWADSGVRCNALSPGGVFNGQDEHFVHKISSLIPMNRMAKVDEYREAVQFLCSDASSYMNGQNIIIDGGRTIL